MSRIGIMGGTFNPIHAGHLMLAEAAREEMQLDEVWFIPTGCSYMKENDSGREGFPSPTERLEMTRLAVEDNPDFRCLDLEVMREGFTYSYETLEELRRKYPANSYYFILGADCLYSIENWKAPERLFAACEIVAAVRGDAAMEEMQSKVDELEKKYPARISLLPFRNLELSSTDIRKRVAEGKSIRYMTTDPVISYIRAKGFYKNENS